MKANEFLHQLKNIPEDTLLTTEHIKGLVEILQPLLKEESKKAEINYDKFADSRLFKNHLLSILYPPL